MLTLAVHSIDLHYGAAQALRDVSVTAEPGRITCVLGRNGSASRVCFAPSPASTR